MNIQIWLWSAVALVFLLLEIGHPGLFYFISFCVGALSAVIFAWLSYSIFFQATIFFIATIGALFFLRMYVKKINVTDHVTNVDALIGKEGFVITEINPDRPGYVKILGEQWLARSNKTLIQGSTVKVIKVSGAHLIVD